MLVKVGTHGQITIPKQYQRVYGIKPGMSVVLIADDDQLAIRPVKRTLRDMRGFLSIDKHVDFNVAREDARDDMSEQYIIDDHE